MDVAAIDSTVFQHDGMWWMFASIQREGWGYNDSLSLFWSTSFPSSEWHPHPFNPVVKGRENSRMAGRIFRDPASGNIVRPAQSCVAEYGEHIVLNRILELSPTVYKEERMRSILPEHAYHAVGTHTWNRSSQHIVRDIKTRVFKGMRR